MSKVSCSVRLSSPRLRVIAWVLVGLYLCVALTLTHMPHPPAEMEKVSDKYLHATGYFVYGSLVYIALGLTYPKRRFVGVATILLLATWAAADELTQPYFGRDCDILDWRADMIGVCIAVAVLAVLRRAATGRNQGAKDK